MSIESKPNKNIRRKKLFLAASLTAGASLACSRGDVSKSFLNLTPEPIDPSITLESPTPIIESGVQNLPITLSPTPTYSETITPTETPVNPFLFDHLDLSKEGPVTMNLKLDFNENVPINLMLSRDDLTRDQANYLIYVLAAPGKGVGLIDSDHYNNALLSIHSGYHNKKPLEAENIREFLEGYNDKTILDRNYVLRKIQLLLGRTVTITQDGKSEQFEIFAIANIPHDKTSDYDRDTKSILDVITSEADTGKDSFNYFKNNRGLLITFCGWGPENASQEHNSPNYRYTYTRYVLGLVPKR